MGPVLEPSVNMVELLCYSALNPATIAVSFMMGRRADQKAKIGIAGFAGAIAGVAIIYFAALLHLWDAPDLGRASAGIFIIGLIAGSVYGALGYMTKHKA